MAKQPKAVDKMTRAELIRLVKALQKRVTKLERQLPNAEHPYGISERAERVLNELALQKRIAKLEAPAYDASMPDSPSRFPWQASLPNSFEGPK